VNGPLQFVGATSLSGLLFSWDLHCRVLVPFVFLHIQCVHFTFKHLHIAVSCIAVCCQRLCKCALTGILLVLLKCLYGSSNSETLIMCYGVFDCQLMSHVAWFVCLSFGHMGALYKNV